MGAAAAKVPSKNTSNKDENSIGCIVRLIEDSTSRQCAWNGASSEHVEGITEILNHLVHTFRLMYTCM